MVKIEKEITPLFNSFKRVVERFYSDFTDEELAVILDFTTNCIRVMIVEIDNLMKDNHQYRSPLRTLHRPSAIRIKPISTSDIYR